MSLPVIFVALLAGSLGAQTAPQPASGVSITQQKAAVTKSERIMALAQARPGLLSQYLYMRDAYGADHNHGFRVIFNQYLSWFQTWVGDYAGARTSFSITQPAERDDSASPLSSGFKSEPALDAIAELASDRQAIFFNENHSIPLTRTLTVQLLTKLRSEGFDTFASETLYDTDTDLQKRGYPVDETGFYTEEPIYAEMVRTALKLGYTIVAYEAISDAIGDAREREQARNLYNDVFKKRPNARLVVNAGFAHIQESGVYLGGQSMAQHFKRLSNIDPLTIEQTFLVPHEKEQDNHPIYNEVIQALHPAVPIVFRDGSGKPWSLKAKGYDVSVVFPSERWLRARPTWLDLGGLRVPYRVNGTLCDSHYPCLVEARSVDEGDDAIPSDRLVLDPDGPLATTRDLLLFSTDATPSGDLYLRPGKYRVIARNPGNQVVGRQNATVQGANPK